MAAACDAGPAVAPAVQHFAGLGSHPQNLERDLHRWVENMYGLELQPYGVPMQIRVKGEVQPRIVEIPVLAPHEIMGALWRAGELQWQVSMFGEENSAVVAEWWERAMMTPWGAAGLYEEVRGGNGARSRPAPIGTRSIVDGRDLLAGHGDELAVFLLSLHSRAEAAHPAAVEHAHDLPHTIPLAFHNDGAESFTEERPAPRKLPSPEPEEGAWGIGKPPAGRTNRSISTRPAQQAQPHRPRETSGRARHL